MKILLISYFMQLQILTMQFSVPTMVKVTVGVLDRYHINCVYLVQSTYETDYMKTVTMGYVKQLTMSRSIQISVIPVSTMRLKNKRNRCQENLPFYIILNNNENTKEFLTKVSRKSRLSLGRWLMFFPIDVPMDEFFFGINIPYDCEFIVVHPNRQDDLLDDFYLTEVYRQHINQSIQTYQVASQDGGGLQWSNAVWFRQRDNLYGQTIKVGIAKKDFKDATTGCRKFKYHQFCISMYEIWSTVEYWTNITTEYVVPDQKHPYLSENGSWTGMIGAMLSGKVDVAIKKSVMTAERIRVVDYISMIFNGKMTTFIKKMGNSGWSQILEPFSPGLWKTVLGSLIALTILLTSTWYLNVRTGTAQGGENYSFHNVWIFIFGIFCQQGHESSPQAWSCRLVYLTAFLTYLIIFTAYSAIFISILAVQHYTIPFVGFQGLLDTNNFKFGVLGESFYVNIFDKAKNPVLKQVYEKLLAPNLDKLPQTSKEGMELVCKGKYAFITDFKVRDNQRLSCEVVEVPRTSFQLPASFLINKRNPYKRIFSHYVDKMREVGILNRIYMQQNPLVTNEEDIPDTLATMEDTKSIFIILAVGIVLSVLCLVAEIISFWFSKIQISASTTSHRRRIPFYAEKIPYNN